MQNTVTGNSAKQGKQAIYRLARSTGILCAGVILKIVSTAMTLPQDPRGYTLGARAVEFVVPLGIYSLVLAAIAVVIGLVWKKGAASWTSARGLGRAASIMYPVFAWLFLAAGLMDICVAVYQETVCNDTRNALSMIQATAIHEEAKEPLVYSTIHEAAEKGNLADVKRHLARGAAVNAKAVGGRTPLHEAAAGGHMDVVEYLVRKGADVNARGKADLSATLRRLSPEYKELAQIMTAADAEHGETDTPLHLAALVGHTDVVEYLLRKGADVNAKTYRGETALHEAAWMGRKDVVECLLAGGADVNAKSDSGETPLHKAAQMGRKDVVECLIAGGADVNAKNLDGYTPLRWAVVLGRKDVVKCLIARGADVNTKESHGYTLLLWAAMLGDKDVVECLIAGGADVNAKNDRGETPLRYAAAQGRGDIVELLKKHGARE